MSKFVVYCRNEPNMICWILECTKLAKGSGGRIMEDVKRLRDANKELELNVKLRTMELELANTRAEEANAELEEMNAELEELNAELEELNAMLQDEIMERKKAEEGIKSLNEELENRVIERTHQLQEMNASLEEEISERIRAEDILLQEKIFIEAVFDSIPGYLYVYDAAGRLVRWNKKHEEMTGYTSEELSKMTLADWFDGEDAVRVATAVEEVFEKGNGEVEAHLLIKGNKKMHIRSTGVRLITDEKTYFVGIGLDITEQKKIEKALVESEARHKAMIDHISDVIGIVDVEGIIRYNSPNITKWFGWEAEELLNRSCFETTHLRDRIVLVNAWAELSKEADKVITIDYKYLCKDGHYKNIELTARNMIHNTSINGILVNFHDVTERKRMEVLLKKSEEQYRLSEESLNKAQKVAQMGNWVWDVENNEVTWSEGMYHIFGIEKMDDQSRLGDIISGAIHPEDIHIVLPSNAEAFVAEKPLEYRIIWPDGSIRNIWTRAGDAVLDESGKALYLTGIAQDITERKLIEDARSQAEAANYAKSTFLANMSHEIRTPINAIIGFNYLIQKTTLSDLQRDYVEKTILSAQNLIGLVNNVLDFSKIEANKIALEENVFDLYEVLNGVSNIISFNLYEKNLKLRFSIEPSIPKFVKGDAFRLTQILLNLINNSIKFTEQGEIEVKLSIKSKIEGRLMVEFIVKDTGIGISEEQQRHLFDAFSQGDMSTTRKYGGTGLGLSITKSLVELMGGTIHLKSAEGQGSQFIFTVRLAWSEEFEVDDCRYSSFEFLKVLLICEDQEMAVIMKSELAQFEVTVKSVESIASGMQALAAVNDYNLVLIDWTLFSREGMGGVHQIIDLISSTAPFIMLLSAHRDHELELFGYDTNVRGILYHPMGKAQLYNKLIIIFAERLKNKAIKRNEVVLLEHVLKNVKILLVEDNEINQQLAKAILQEYGTLVSIAENGLMALEMIEKEIFDIILMDLQMPVMDGYEAAKIIRGKEAYKKTPIIAMSAHALKGIKEKTYEAGMNDYIAKPFEVAKMVGTLIEWVGKKELNR